MTHEGAAESGDFRWQITTHGNKSFYPCNFQCFILVVVDNAQISGEDGRCKEKFRVSGSVSVLLHREEESALVLHCVPQILILVRNGHDSVVPYNETDNFAGKQQPNIIRKTLEEYSRIRCCVSPSYFSKPSCNILLYCPYPPKAHK